MQTAITKSCETNLHIMIDEIYEVGFYQVARLVSRDGGSLEDAKDIFHEACVVLYQQSLAGKELTSPVNYVTGIAKHLWFKETRKRRRRSDTPDNMIEADHPSCEIVQSKLLVLLERAGKRCLDLLESFYIKGDSLQHIVQAFGFSSEHSASVQKYKCLEKLRDVVRTKSLSYEDFTE